MPANILRFRHALPLILGFCCLSATGLTVSPAYADPAAAAATPDTGDDAPQPARRHGLSLDQKLTKLHDALQITAAEEAGWASVAGAIREGAAEVRAAKLDRKAHYSDMTALANIETYHKVSLAMADSEVKLLAAFKPLYASFPAAQQKLADGAVADFLQPYHRKKKAAAGG